MASKSSKAPAGPSLPSEQEFWDWASQVPVASRDKAYGPITPWGTQRRLIHEIFEGLQGGRIISW